MKSRMFLAAVTLIAVAGVGAWYWLRWGSRASAINSAPAALPPIVTTPAPIVADPPQEATISIPSSEVDRLRLRFAKATEAIVASEIRVPGTVQPNAYKQVHVTPIAGGVVTQVNAEIGQAVQRGQTLVQIFSRELAEAQTKYLADNAELEVEHKKLIRTQELVRLGAASRQEMEEVEANHQVHSAHVEESRQRLLLLGLSGQQIADVAAGKRAGTTIAVPSPLDGVVTARSVNLGQVVNASQDLLTVTDLTSVWVEAHLLEDNFAAVRIGSPATITSIAYPGRHFRGGVSYIDPQVDPQTRTAKVRVALDNPGGALRFGMYLDILFATAAARTVVVPKEAVQTIGASNIVFVPVKGEDGRFIQRPVKTGVASPSGFGILEGLKAGETVVTEGSFLLRAEAIRQHQ